MSLTVESARQALSQVIDPALGKDVVKYRFISSAARFRATTSWCSSTSRPTPIPRRPGASWPTRVKAALDRRRREGRDGDAPGGRPRTSRRPARRRCCPGSRTSSRWPPARAAWASPPWPATWPWRSAPTAPRSACSTPTCSARRCRPCWAPAQAPPSVTPDQKIIPALHHGLKVISVGFFADKDEAVVWRGPMVHRLLQQFLADVDVGRARLPGVRPAARAPATCSCRCRSSSR